VSPYEVTRDGQRFLVLTNDERAAQPLTMIVNWPARLSGNRLFIYMQKTKVPVYLPLPPFVVEALDALPLEERSLLVLDRHWIEGYALVKLAAGLPTPLRNPRGERWPPPPVSRHTGGAVGAGGRPHRAQYCSGIHR
jgi:hypothetical protein